MQSVSAQMQAFIFEAPPGFLSPTSPHITQRVQRCPIAFNAYIKALREGGLNVQFKTPFHAVYVRPAEVQARIDAARGVQ